MPEPEADFDFSHWQAAKVNPERPIKYRVNWQFPLEDGSLSPRPVLLVLPATQENARYTAARQNGVRRGITKMRDLTPEANAAARTEDRELFAKYVIVGWEEGTVLNRKGVVIPHSVKACEAMLAARACPDELFDELRNFCFDWSNFTSLDVEAFAKNS